MLSQVHLAGFEQGPAQLRGLGRTVGYGQGLGSPQQSAGVAADVAVVRAFGGGAGEQVRGQQQGVRLTRAGGGAFGEPAGV
ncbi:hypothetical protein ABZ858_30000 [Streptomyces sp. NPDC047017]|uniref:hypothetical protein n=1 Tax=Streptomyces sp. NPDC047017 TaxID=3155024 RepID=UPI003400096F